MGYPYQSGVQDQDAIRFGSCKVEIGATTASYTTMGIAKGVTFTEEITKSIVGADNAPELHFVRKQRAVVSGTFVEYDPLIWNTIRGGIDTYTTSTGDSGWKMIETGGLHPMSSVALKLTNSRTRTVGTTTDGSTAVFEIMVWKAYWDGPFTLAFPPDEGEEPMEIPFQFTGVPSSTKTTGRKLYRIRDMQTTS